MEKPNGATTKMSVTILTTISDLIDCLTTEEKELLQKILKEHKWMTKEYLLIELIRRSLITYEKGKIHFGI